jgi:hypothetical protein
MNAHDIYRKAIKRVFANLYGVSPDEVDVSWSSDRDAIIVHCLDKTFTHEILSDDNDLRSNSSATSKIRSPSG